MNNEMSKTRQMLIEGYIESLEQEQIPWKKGWNNGDSQHNPITNTFYRGINQLLLNYIYDERRYEDPRWLTFNQIRKEGWTLENAKGQGVPVEKWGIYDREEKKYINVSDMKKIIAEEQLEGREVDARFCWSCKTFTVFNASLVKGIEKYEIIRNEFDIDEVGFEMIKNYCDATDLAIIEGRQSKGKAFYNKTYDTVYVPDRYYFDDSYEYLATILHECCHSTGHPNRLNRNMLNEHDEYALEELRAEIGSSFLCGDLGLDISNARIDNHKAYIQSWISGFKEKPNVLLSAINDAKKITDYIENKGELSEIIERQKCVIQGRKR